VSAVTVRLTYHHAASEQGKGRTK